MNATIDKEAYNKAVEKFEDNHRLVGCYCPLTKYECEKLGEFFLINKDHPQKFRSLVGYRDSNGNYPKCAIGLLSEPDPKKTVDYENLYNFSRAGIPTREGIIGTIYMLNDTFRLSFEEMAYFFMWRAAKLPA